MLACRICSGGQEYRAWLSQLISGGKMQLPVSMEKPKVTFLCPYKAFWTSPDLRLLYKCLEKSLLVFPNKPEVVGLCFCSTGILTLEEPPWPPKHNFNCLWTVSTNINVYSGSRSKTTDNKDPWLWNCLNLLQALVISEDSFYLVMPGNWKSFNSENWKSFILYITNI